MSTPTSDKKPPKSYSYPSYEKNGELALFYNLAYNRTDAFIKKSERKTGSEDIIRNLFTGPGNKMQELLEKNWQVHLFCESTYADLNLFLFKEETGKMIRRVSPEDIRNINKTLFYLLRIRDYQSHYWHSDAGLYMDENYAAFINHKMALAVGSYEYKILPKISQVKVFDDNRVYHDDIVFFKLRDIDGASRPGMKLFNGINFFLSFFLTTGLMEVFMNNREFLKNKGVKKDNNGVPVDYDFARYLCSYYTLRESHRINLKSLKKRNIDEESLVSTAIPFGENEQERLLMFDIHNYLQTLPNIIIDEYNLDKDLLQDKGLIRRGRNKFSELAIKWLGQQTIGDGIEWQVYSDVFEEVEVAKKEETLEGESEAYSTGKYLKRVNLYRTTFHDDDRIISRDGRVRLRLKIDDNRFVKLTLWQEDFLMLMSMIVYKEKEAGLKFLLGFANEAAGFVSSIAASVKFDVDKTSFLKNFISEPQNSFFPPVLVQLNEKTNNTSAEQWNLETLKALEERFRNLKVVVTNYRSGFANMQTMLKRLTRDDYNKWIRLRELISMEKLGKIRSEERGELEELDDEIYTKRSEIREINRPLLGVRNKKMTIILKCLKWLCSRRDYFKSIEDIKLFSRFAYLLDTGRKEDLVITWFERQDDELKKIIKASGSFDSLFENITNAAIKRFDYEAAQLSTQTEQKAIQGIARKFGLKNSSVLYSRMIDSDRLQEILRTFMVTRKVDGTTSYDEFFFNLPKYFFKTLIDNKDSAKSFINRLRNEKEYRAQVYTWANALKNAAGIEVPFFTNDIKTLIENKNAIKSSNPTKAKEIVVLLEKIKDTHNILLQDCLLEKMMNMLLLKAHQTEWREFRKTTTLFQNLVVKNYEGIKVTMQLKELFENDSYIQEDRVSNIARLLSKKNEKNVTKGKTQNVVFDFTLREIKEAIIKHWIDSSSYISGLLMLESIAVPKMEIPEFSANLLYGAELPHYKFREDIVPVLIKASKPEDRQLINELESFRSIAFHGDILLRNSYGFLKIKAEELKISLTKKG